MHYQLDIKDRAEKFEIRAFAINMMDYNDSLLGSVEFHPFGLSPSMRRFLVCAHFSFYLSVIGVLRKGFGDREVVGE